MIRNALLPIALAISGGARAAVPSDEEGAAPRVLATAQEPAASLDALIDALPPVGREVVHADERAEPAPAALELRRRLEAGLALDDAQWRRALLSTGAIRLRARWPTSRAFAIGVQVPWWLGDGAEIRVAPRRDGWRAARAGTTPEHAETALYQELGPLPPGDAPLSLELDVVVARAGAGAPLWSGTLSHAVRPVASVADAIAPESGPEVDALVRAAAGLAFRTGPYDDEPDRSPVLVIDAPPAAGEPLALVLRVEVLRAGEVVEERRVVALARDPAAPHPDRSAAWVPLQHLPEDAAGGEGALEGWAVRLTGVEPGALGVFEAERRYEGSVTIPLAEARARELERAGAHGREPWPWRARPR